MNAGWFLLCPTRPQYFAVSRLIVLLSVVAILCPYNSVAQQAVHKLTLTQVEDLVSHHVPDSTMHTEIQRRGLAFTPNAAIVETLRAKGAGPLTLSAIEALFPKTTPAAQTSKPTLAAKNGGAKPVRGRISMEKGNVEVRTEPGSQLVMDGKDVGSAGADGSFMLQDVIKGDHELLTRKEGYHETSTRFSLAKNENKQLSLPMEWLGGYLSVSALPSGARIQVVGPQSFEGGVTDTRIVPGTYTATVTSDGYLKQTRNFQIGAGEHHVELFPLAIDLVGAKAKADAGDQSSLYVLEQAVARGEEVVCKVKLTSVDMAVGAYMYDGTVTVSNRGVSFKGKGGDRYKPDFTVSPENIFGLAYENPQPAQNINLRVAIMNRKGKQDKHTYQLYNSGAALVVVGRSGPTNIVNIACNGCDNSLNVLYTLLQKVRGMN